MNTSERIAKALEAQRNQAFNAAAMATAQRDEIAEMLGASFMALHQCILSGQVPQEDAPALVASVPGFAEWRASKT